jgi:hypothetical protein
MTNEKGCGSGRGLIEVLSQHLSERTEEDDEKSVSIIRVTCEGNCILLFCVNGSVSVCCLPLQEVEGLVNLFGSPAGRALVTSSSSGNSGSSSSRQPGGSRKQDGRLLSKARRKERRKSSTELYKEAAALLGLTCSMNDSCRCIECQVMLLHNSCTVLNWRYQAMWDFKFSQRRVENNSMFRVVFWDILPCKMIVDRNNCRPTFQRYVLPPSSGRSNLMMLEAARTSWTSVDNYFIWQYIPEDKSERYLSILLCSRQIFRWSRNFLPLWSHKVLSFAFHCNFSDHYLM